MKELQIKVGSKEDRAMLLGVLYAVGGIFHRDDEFSLERACNNYCNVDDWGFIRVSRNRNNEITIASMRNAFHSLDWSEDPSTVLEAIRKYVNYQAITINDVGDYKAVVSKDGIQVGCQTISLEKFQEIADAVLKIK